MDADVVPCVIAFGDDRFVTKSLVPEPRVMSAHVPHGVDGVQPRGHDRHLDVELVGDGLPNGFGRTLVKLGNQAKVETLNDNPVRRKLMGIPVFLLEMISKGLVASVETLLGLRDERIVLVVGKTRKVGPVQVSKRSLKMRQLVGEPGTYVDFYALDGIKNNETKTPVKSVGIPNFAKAGSSLKRIVTVSVWIQISAQPVVADCLKMSDEGISVAFETTRNEQVRLLFVSQCFLQVFRNGLQERKEPPKCASVRGMAALLMTS